MKTKPLNTLTNFIRTLKMKMDFNKEKPYNPEFVEKIMRSKKEYEEGKYITMYKEDIEAPDWHEKIVLKRIKLSKKKDFFPLDDLDSKIKF